MKNIIKMTKEEFNNVIKNKKILGAGSEGPAYYLGNNIVLKHINEESYKSLRCDEDNTYTIENIIKFHNINSKNYYFPKAIICINEDIEAYIMKRCPGYNLTYINSLTINLRNLKDAISRFNKDTLYISNKHIKGYDMYFNYMYDNENFGAIDTVDYSYSDEDERSIYKFNIGCFNDEFLQLLIEKYFLYFIKQDSLLNDIYNSIKANEILDLNEFISPFRKKINEYLDKDIMYLGEAKKIARKNEEYGYPNSPTYSLKK